MIFLVWTRVHSLQTSKLESKSSHVHHNVPFCNLPTSCTAPASIFLSFCPWNVLIDTFLQPLGSVKGMLQILSFPRIVVKTFPRQFNKQVVLACTKLRPLFSNQGLNRDVHHHYYPKKVSTISSLMRLPTLKTPFYWTFG